MLPLGLGVGYAVFWLVKRMLEREPIDLMKGDGSDPAGVELRL